MRWTQRVRFDETPLRLLVLDSETLWQLADCTSDTLRSVLAEAAAAASDAAITKLLQTERHIALLVWVGGQYFSFRFRPPAWVQSMGRTTANCFYHCTWLSWCALQVEDEVKRFMYRDKLVATDGDLAIGRAERADLPHPGSHDSTMHLLCSTHSKSNARVDCLSLVPYTVIRIRRAVLSFLLGNSLKVFRAALRVLLVHRARCIRNRLPSQSQRTMNEKALTAILPNQPDFLELRATLLCLFPGVWGEWRVIETWPEDGVTDEEHLQRILVTVARVAVGRGPVGFPTRNWVGCDMAPRWLATLELPHRLFSQAFCIMEAMATDKYKKEDPLACLPAWCDDSYVDGRALVPPAPGVGEHVEDAEDFQVLVANVANLDKDEALDPNEAATQKECLI